MSSWKRVAGLLMVVGILAGCGGGGGGGGGIGGASPASAPATSVLINGAAVTADGSGQYDVKPGDTVEITSSTASVWTTSTVSGASLLGSPTSTPTKWSARLVNRRTSPGTYTVTAKAADNFASFKDTVLRVAGGDARNGDYKVFSTTGYQPKLSLNFDTQTYDVMDAVTAVTSNVFTADPTEPGTYVFVNDRVLSAANVTRFRVTADAIVGSFPFAMSWEPLSLSVQPFIAARSFVTQQDELDGVYNRFGTQVNPTTRDSLIRQLQITNGGKTLRQCIDPAIVAVASCPSGSLLEYAVSPGPDGQSWLSVNLADPNDRELIYMANINGQKVYLSAEVNVAGDNVFRVGLPDTGTWPNSVARGGDTADRWSKFTLDATTAAITAQGSSGSTDNFNIVFSGLGSLGPTGMRISGSGLSALYLMQGSKLSVLTSTSGNGTGYMLLGLQD